jgi:small subunit ribosomal protein S1
LPLKVIEFDKESKKIVLSVLEYFRGKEQKVVDEYVNGHKLSPMTMKDIVNVPPVAPDELQMDDTSSN